MRMLCNLTAVAMLAALSGCNNPSAEPRPTLHEVMAGTIDPVADVIWETSSKSYGDDGKAHVSNLTDKDWLAIQQAARKLHDGADLIVGDPGIVAVRTGVKIPDDGVVAEAVIAAQVATYISSTPRQPSMPPPNCSWESESGSRTQNSCVFANHGKA
jgi:hypothetical protein